MVAAQRKTPSRRGMTAYEYAQAMARHNARWDHIPPAYREIPEDEDSQERLDALNEEERYDPEAHRQGNVADCPCTQKIQEEAEAERRAQMYG